MLASSKTGNFIHVTHLIHHHTVTFREQKERERQQKLEQEKEEKRRRQQEEEKKRKEEEEKRRKAEKEKAEKERAAKKVKKKTLGATGICLFSQLGGAGGLLKSQCFSNILKGNVQVLNLTV